MSTKYSSWTSTDQSLATMNTDLSEGKTDEQDQYKVENGLHIHTSINTSTSAFIANSSISSKVQPSEKSPNEDVSTTPKPKPKHRCHHHNGKHKCRYHQRRIKASQQKTQHSKSLSSPRFLRKKSSDSVPDSGEQPKTTHRKISNNDKPVVITDTVRKTDQRASDEQKAKTNQGNIPLQSVENKIVSQRETSANEMQVGNCSACVYAQPLTTMINTDAVQQVEQVYYEENCCLPQSTVGCSTNSCSCIVQQPVANVCVSQQQPIVLTSGISSTNCICSTSGACSSTTCVCSTRDSGFLQQVTSPQQQIVYVNNTSPATIINQASACNPISVNSFASPTVCVSQAPLQSVANLVIQQQPQILPQPVQLIQSSQPVQYIQLPSATPQFIQSPQAQPVQYVQIPSAAPQLIQMPTQAIAASPQILYQRPYDSLALPVQNQQLAIGNVPGMPLRYPSYAPPRIPSGAPTQQAAGGPNLFRQALVRTVANRTGTPVLSPSPMGLQIMQPPIPSQGMRGPLLSTASALPNPGIQGSPFAPIVPLTAGGLLIPFQPSQSPQGPIPKTVSRPATSPSTLTNFDNIRRQIQDRARVLADLRRQNANQISAFPRPSADVSLRSRPPFPLNTSVSPPILSSNTPQIPSTFAPNTPLPRLPPPVIRSQTPYTSGNIFGSSSGSNDSSDRSTTSSPLPPTNTGPSSSGLTYSTPSLIGSRNGSDASRMSPSYQPLRP